MSEGVVYLICFDKPIGDLDNPRGQARHYLGFASANGAGLEARLQAHRSGNGSAIMRAVREAGIDWQVVRVWDGGRNLERRLKRQKNARRFCPICKGQAAGQAQSGRPAPPEIYGGVK